MQLDKTHVVIRVRSLSEIGDLAMVMIRQYPSALLVGFLAGALPWIILNAAALSWIPIEENQYGISDDEARSELFRYGAWMLLLIALQTPIAGVFTTIYLGQAVFEKRPTWSAVFREGRRQFWRWFWVLGVKRLAIPALLLVAVRYGAQFNAVFDVMLPIVILVGMTIVRASRPFAPEILLLEQCPLRTKAPGVINAARRSKSLHSPMSSELSGRFLSVSFIACVLFLSVLWTMIWVRGIVSGKWDWGLFVLLVLIPAAAWVIAGLSILIRLLNYLDTRIRLEGWEVELAIRAEAIRQFGEETALPKNAQTDQPETTKTKNASSSQSKQSVASSTPNQSGSPVPANASDTEPANATDTGPATTTSGAVS